MRRRIVGLTVLAAVLAISLFGIPLGILAGRLYQNDEQAELERAADSTAIAVAADLLSSRQLRDLPPVERGMQVSIYDKDGTRIRGAGPARSDATVRRALRGNVTSGAQGDRLVVAVPISDNARVTGVVSASTTRSETYRRIGTTWLLMLVLGAAAVGVAWLLARRQAARLAGPLERLADSAQRLGDGDFSVRAGTAGIAEIDSVGAALDSTATRLGSLVTRERAFSADASHQLRTPLTGLRLVLENALEERDGDRTAAIGSALASTDRLERTVHDLLALARDVPDRAAVLDLPALLAEVRQTWQAELAATGRSLQLAVDPEAPASRASAAAVRQVLSVLVDNSARHGSGAVTVRARDAGRALAIDVSDEGTGPDRDDLFARRGGATDGHGIGLAMARSIAEAEGGRLTLRRPSPPTFTLLLPAVTSERDVDETRS